MGEEQETHVNEPDVLTHPDNLGQEAEQMQPEDAQEQFNPPNSPKQPKKKTREERIETAFVGAVRDAGGLALKFTSQTMNGVPDRLVLFKLGKCAFVEVKAPGKQMRPLQRKRRKQLESLGFPVFCVDDFSQIKPVIQALQEWNPGEPFPTGVGAVISEIEDVVLPGETVLPEEAVPQDEPDAPGGTVLPGEAVPQDEPDAPGEVDPPGEAVLSEEPTGPAQSATPVSPAALNAKEVLPHEVHTP